MSVVDVRVSTKVSRSMRARQLSAMFDVPEQDESEREWSGDVPLDERDWNVGLIVGPSGAGKSTSLVISSASKSCRAGTASRDRRLRADVSMEEIARAVRPSASTRSRHGCARTPCSRPASASVSSWRDA
jgi:ABC-type cobalamin/Fe3+-siderophores transport system ATPase subunit